MNTSKVSQQTGPAPAQEITPRSNDAVFPLPARVVGIASAITALACLATLVVVTSVSDVDSLSTVALALAILAFAIQIIVFIAQANAAQSQMLRSEEINSDSRALLTDLRSTALSTQTLVGEQFGQLLGAFMDAAKTTAKEGGGKLDPVELERKMMENVRREFGSRGTATARAVPEESPAQRARRIRRDAAIAEQAARAEREAKDGNIRLLLTFPNADEGAAAWRAIERLPPAARICLRALAEDELRSRRNGQFLGLATAYLDDIGESASLLSSGLAELARTEDAVIARLTDAGRDVARIFTAQGDLPDWIDGQGLVNLLGETAVDEDGVEE